MGNPSNDALELSGTDGFGELTTLGPQQWRFQPPDSFGGRASVELAVHPEARAEPQAVLTLRLKPAEAASSSIEPASATAHVGGAPLRLRARRADRFGNTVPGMAPTAVAEEGRFAAVDPLPDGAFVATYVPPDRWDRDDTAIEMRWPGTSAHANVVLLPRLAQLTISPKVGGLSNLARLNSPLAAVEATFRTERFGPELGFGGELAWYFVSQEQSAGQIGTAQARDDFVTRLTISASAGPSLQFIASRLQLGSQPQVSESGVVPGIVLGLGVERRFARAVPFGELRWSWHADPGFSSLTGSISAFSFVVGNRFELL
jgi:hypothetical protein